MNKDDGDDCGDDCGGDDGGADAEDGHRDGARLTTAENIWATDRQNRRAELYVFAGPQDTAE